MNYKHAEKIIEMPGRKSLMKFNELFQILQKTDESNKIEVKSAAHGLGKSFLEAVSAFSNEPNLEGGYIILGLSKNPDQKESRYHITGVADPDNLQRQIASQCLDLLSIPIRPHIQVSSYLNKTVLVIYIEEANALQKPVFIKSLGWTKGAYRRIGSTNQCCIPEDIKFFLQLQSGLRYEEMPEPRSSFEDFDPQAIEMYRYKREKIKADATELRYNDLDLMKALQAITTTNGATHPTIGGLLLFGSKPSLRRLFALRNQIDYIITQENELSKGHNSIEFSECLITGIPKIVEYIMDDIPMTFSLDTDGLTRKDIPLIPRKVIREALINAATHRDYQHGGSMMVIKYPHKLEFRNYGYSLKSTNPLKLVGSVARNVNIAKVFQDIDYAEAKGSGINRMREAMIDSKLIVPLIESNREDNYFVLTLLNHCLNNNDYEWLSKFNLSEDEIQALVAMREMREITNSVYRSIHLVDSVTASSQLNKLQKRGIIEQKGLSGFSIQENILRPINSLKYSAHNPSAKSDLNDVEPLLSGLTEDIREKVLQIGKKAHATEVLSIIKILCSIQPYKPKELGRLLRRATRHITERYIGPLVESGELELLYPGNPAHPNQAYKTKNNNPP